MNSVNCYTCRKTPWRGNTAPMEANEILRDFADAGCDRSDCPNTREVVDVSPEALLTRIEALERKFSA